MRAWVEGIGLIGPGLRGWRDSRAVLAGHEPYVAQPVTVPASDWLPPAERRRTGLAVRLALAVGREACEHAHRDPRTLATVFTSSGGDGDNQHVICESLASATRELSPTRFHNSVHNAPAGYWGVATGSMENSTTLCAYDWSFGAGLVEALTWLGQEQQPILLIAYDTPYPEPMHAVRPLVAAFGVAFVFTPGATGHSVATLEVDLSPDAPTGSLPAGLDVLCGSAPSARSLPMLHALARAAATTAQVEYLDGRSLIALCTPC